MECLLCCSAAICTMVDSVPAVKVPLADPLCAIFSHAAFRVRRLHDATIGQCGVKILQQRRHGRLQDAQGGNDAHGAYELRQ